MQIIFYYPGTQNIHSAANGGALLFSHLNLVYLNQDVRLAVSRRDPQTLMFLVLYYHLKQERAKALRAYM